MPGRDGTGPMGAGTMTGRGLGYCTGGKAVQFGRGYGLGLACRRGAGGGFGRGFAYWQTSNENQKDLLQKQRDILKTQLEAIDKQLEDL